MFVVVLVVVFVVVVILCLRSSSVLLYVHRDRTDYKGPVYVVSLPFLFISNSTWQHVCHNRKVIRQIKFTLMSPPFELNRLSQCLIILRRIAGIRDGGWVGEGEGGN